MKHNLLETKIRNSYTIFLKEYKYVLCKICIEQFFAVASVFPPTGCAFDVATFI